MIDAWLYLLRTSVTNAVRLRLKRLRQPKYAIGAVVGIAYFYFLLFRDVDGDSSLLARGVPLQGLSQHFQPLASFALFVMAALTWVLPSRRAALQFSEAEVAFLFPAPVSRRALIHAKLLRSQIGVLFSTFLLTVLFRRGALGGSGMWIQAIGLWMLFSTITLHGLAVSFARERLLDFGIDPLRRRLLVVAILTLLLGSSYFALGWVLPPLRASDTSGLPELLSWANRALDTPPLRWMLLPFAWPLGPWLANDGNALLRAMLPAGLLLLAHYFWVVRSNVAFQEASIALAAKRAELVAAVRRGRLNASDRPRKARRPPFQLSVRGPTPLAFLWSALIALGPFYRLRTVFVIVVLITLTTQLASVFPPLLIVVKIISLMAVVLAVMVVLFAPMLMRHHIGQMMEQLEISKAWPVSGKQLVLGQMLGPILLVTVLQWLLLFTAAVTYAAVGGKPALAFALSGAGSAAIALLTPAVAGLLMCIPFAAALYFPAWTHTSTPHGHGVEVVGQRLLMAVGFLVALVLALLPAVLLGALAFVLAKWTLGVEAGLIAGALAISAFLIVEFGAAIEHLGERLDRFDLSTELGLSR